MQSAVKAPLSFNDAIMSGTRKDQIEVSSMLTNPDMSKIHLALKLPVKPK